MDYQMVMQMIATVGFPCAVCLILLWYIFKSGETHKSEVKTLTRTYEENVQQLMEKHEKECRELSEALNNNTVVMSQILEHIRKEKL